MRIQDIIRSMLNVIDGAEQPAEPEQPTILIAHPEEKPGQDSPFTNTGDDINRWLQIVDLADAEEEEFDNAPHEKVAGIDAVTVNAGGGVNGPKHPRDLRGNSFPIYPEEE